MVESNLDFELKTCTARIVSSYVAFNRIEPEELTRVITSVYYALANLGKDQLTKAPLIPAIPIRRSLRRDMVICLDCGFKAKMLRRHLFADHGLTPDQYRARWGLSADYPMTAPNYSQERSTLAKETGLGYHPHRRQTLVDQRDEDGDQSS